MDIEVILRMLVLGKISPEKAAKLIVIRARRILVQQNFTTEQIMRFGAEIAVKVLDATMEILKTCQEKGGEEI